MGHCRSRQFQSYVCTYFYSFEDDADNTNEKKQRYYSGSARDAFRMRGVVETQSDLNSSSKRNERKGLPYPMCLTPLSLPNNACKVIDTYRMTEYPFIADLIGSKPYL